MDRLILWASPTIPAVPPYSLAHRVVVREWAADEFVVHTQIFRADGTSFFDRGDYFPFGKNREYETRRIALMRAEDGFMERYKKIRGDQ
jgi:hypothetical protein